MLESSDACGPNTCRVLYSLSTARTVVSLAFGITKVQHLDASLLCRELPISDTYKPVRKAIRTMCTANGIRLVKEGARVTAAAERSPVQSPTTQVSEARVSSSGNFSDRLNMS